MRHWGINLRRMIKAEGRSIVAKSVHRSTSPECMHILGEITCYLTLTYSPLRLTLRYANERRRIALSFEGSCSILIFFRDVYMTGGAMFADVNVELSKDLHMCPCFQTIHKSKLTDC